MTVVRIDTTTTWRVGHKNDTHVRGVEVQAGIGIVTTAENVLPPATDMAQGMTIVANIRREMSVDTGRVRVQGAL